MSGFSIEPTITWGTIIQTIALLAGFLGAWLKIQADLLTVKGDVKSLQSSSDSFSRALQQLSVVLTQVAVQDNRLVNMEKRLDELAHGKGFIQ